MGDRPRFAVDEMLGSLARWLRIIGYDASYQRDKNDSEILRSSLEEGRILLTRDRELAGRAGKNGLLITSDRLDEQLNQVMESFHLTFEEPMTRCALCNAELEKARPEEISHLVPSRVLERNDEFFRCRGCGQVFWKGTHWDNIKQRLAEIDSSKS